GFSFPRRLAERQSIRTNGRKTGAAAGLHGLNVERPGLSAGPLRFPVRAFRFRLAREARGGRDTDAGTSGEWASLGGPHPSAARAREAHADPCAPLAVRLGAMAGEPDPHALRC